MAAPDGYALGYYLVAFVDLLGQGDELDQLKELPQSEDERLHVRAILKRTAGRVLQIRATFDDLFKTVTQLPAPPSLTAEQRDQFQRARQIRYVNRGISDSFIIALPLEERDQHPYTAALGVYAALYGVAGIYLAGLVEGVPMRGGIDVGLAINLRPDEIYGPVLRCAYRLESHDAEYPRVLIGATLVDYLESFARRRPRDPFEGLAIATLADANRLLCRDLRDGKPMLHALSDGFFDIAPDMRLDVGKARKWIDETLQGFRAANNPTLAERYERLAQYFDHYLGASPSD